LLFLSLPAEANNSTEPIIAPTTPTISVVLALLQFAAYEPPKKVDMAVPIWPAGEPHCLNVFRLFQNTKRLAAITIKPIAAYVILIISPKYNSILVQCGLFWATVPPVAVPWVLVGVRAQQAKAVPPEVQSVDLHHFFEPRQLPQWLALTRYFEAPKVPGLPALASLTQELARPLQAAQALPVELPAQNPPVPQKLHAVPARSL
jgi:hypothetical protein